MINACIVGCGRISKKHINAILSFNSRIRLVALVDTNTSSLEESFEYFNSHPKCPNNKPKCYDDLSKLLVDFDNSCIQLDLAIICTPSGLHPKHCKLFGRKGLNVCTEKPMATHFAEGRDLVHEFDSLPGDLFVVKQNRFNRTVTFAKSLLEQKKLGRLKMINCNVFWQRPQSYYDQAAWRGTWEFDGGALMNQASHYVDLLTWLVGPVESVFTNLSTTRDIEVEDTASVSVRWRGGAIGSLNVTMLTYPKNLEGSLTILGEKGSIKLAGQALNKIDYALIEDTFYDEDVLEKINYSIDSIYGHGHEAFYANIINHLEGNHDALCTGREGLKSLEFLTACYKSACTGGKVSLPLL